LVQSTTNNKPGPCFGGLVFILSSFLVVVFVAIPIARFHDLPRIVVSVLLVKNTANHHGMVWESLLPAVKDSGISIGFMPAGDFVVSVILKTGHSQKLRIKRRGSVPPFGKDSHWLVCRIA